MNVDLERAGKALPLAVAAIYVTGFLVVAGRLALYGTSSLELFKIQYLAAGFWCGFTFVLYFWFVTAVRSFCKFSLEARQTRLPGVALNLLSNGVSIVLLVGFIYFVQRFFPSHSSLWLFYSLVVVDFALRTLMMKETDSPWSQHSFWARGLFVLLLFIGYVFAFSDVVHADMPFSLGGGRPRSVVFVLNDGTGPTSSFLVRDGTGPRTIPYQLSLENENSFVVSPKAGEKAIEFDRKSVAAMIVLESPKKP